MAKDFSKRTKSTQRSAATNAGWMNDPVHVNGAPTAYKVTPAGGYVLQRVIFGTPPSSGTVILKIGNDTLAELSSTVASGSMYFNVYLYDILYYSTDAAADVTFIISKG